MVEKEISRRTEFRGKLLQLDSVQVELSDGRPALREVVWHPEAVCAAVLTPEREWVLVRQFRFPAQDLLLEVPAGKIDPGEDPDTAIWRELREEIGLVSGKVERLCQFWSTPGFCNEKMTTYVVTEAVLGPSQLDEGEFLEVERVELREGLIMALDGRVGDAKSILALLAAARHLGL